MMRYDSVKEICGFPYNHHVNRKLNQVYLLSVLNIQGYWRWLRIKFWKEKKIIDLKLE